MAIRRRVRKAANDPVSPDGGGGARKAARSGKGRRVARTPAAVAAHVQLANAILRGEFSKPCTWSILKLMYFGAKTDEACDRALAKWSKQHGILYEKRPIRIAAPGVDVRDFEVTFRRR